MYQLGDTFHQLAASTQQTGSTNTEPSPAMPMVQGHFNGPNSMPRKRPIRNDAANTNQRNYDHWYHDNPTDFDDWNKDNATSYDHWYHDNPADYDAWNDDYVATENHSTRTSVPLSNSSSANTCPLSTAAPLNQSIDEYSVKSLYNGPSEQKECAICMAPFQNREEIRRLGCLHFFHANCIENGLKVKKECPVCRLIIFKEE
jgi:hypothetical protein